MARYSYERLSAQDNSFLVAETPNVHMHVAGTQIFDAGPLTTPDGGVDIEAFKRATEAVIHLIPHYRQRLKWIPLEGHPVWVDDRRFNLDYHIRHTALPRPGSIEQLKRLCARVMSQPLDRARPLWETWVVEGLEGNRFAVISKIHHCMMDGTSGVDLAQILLSPSPEYEIGEVMPYVPMAAPSGWELMRDAFLRSVRLPFDMLRDVREFTRQTADVQREVWTRAKAIAELLGWAVRPAPETPLNGRLGPHRRFDWLTMPLADVKAVRRSVGCSVNDVILATVAGALRDFLLRRRVRPETIDFRVSAPVSMRRDEERGKFGNRVSSWIIKLPVGEENPLKRLDAIHRMTQELKASRQALGVEMIMAMAEWTPTFLVSLGARAASGPINTIVTNVPGPQFPLYLLGAKLVEAFPLVPLLENTGLGIALFSYDGKLCWGFNGDYELMPDLRTFVRAIEASFAALAKAAGGQPASVESVPPRAAERAREASRGASAAPAGDAVAEQLRETEVVATDPATNGDAIEAGPGAPRD
jgi:diacylglycerol O-acyltransferase